MFFIHIEFTSADVTVDISVYPPTLLQSGDSVVMTCKVEIPSDITDSPTTLILSYDSRGRERIDSNVTDIMETLVTNEEGSVFSRNITFQSIQTSDARGYYCIVMFDQLQVTAYNFYNLTLKSKPYTNNYKLLFITYYL